MYSVFSLRRENGAPKVPSVSVTTWKQIHGGGGRTGTRSLFIFSSIEYGTQEEGGWTMCDDFERLKW